MHILVFLLCYCTFVKNWWGTHSIFVKYVRYNLIVSHHCHDWNFWLVNKVALLLYKYIRDYLCNTYHIRRPGGVLVIPFKPEAEGICTWLSCCYCVLHKNITVTKFADFSLVCYRSWNLVALVVSLIVTDGRKLEYIALACSPMAYSSYEISFKLVSLFIKLKCGVHTEAA